MPVGELFSTVLFYLFSMVMLASGLRVISAKNPVHAVLFLILAFCNAAALFLLIGAEYLAMTLVIVYVGAVAVLFLFVVMMLDVNFAELRQGFLRYVPLGLGVASVIFVELLLIFYQSVAMRGGLMRQAAEGSTMNNTRALGNVLYTEYLYPFQVAGLVLLVAMVGAIVLTLRHKVDVRRQNAGQQVSRKRKDAIAIVQVKSGQGA